MRNRHPYSRQVSPKPLPKFWRPKISSDQVLKASIIHNELLANLTTGKATTEMLWDWMETCFTYIKFMQLLMEDGMEFTEDAKIALAAQVETFEPICERLRRTGKVGLSGPEIRIAQEAAAVMDELIQLDRHGVAEKAARWSIQQMAKIRRSVQ